MRRIILIAAALFLGSCGASKDAELELTFTTKKAFLIDADTNGCYQAIQARDNDAEVSLDMTSMFFTYMNPQLKWKNTEMDAYIAYIKLKVASSNLADGYYTCITTGDELNAIFSDTATVGVPITLWNQKLVKAPSSGSPTVRPSGYCNYLRCGGLTPLDKTKPFTATVTVEVGGFAQKDSDGDGRGDGEEIPIRVTSTLQVEHSP